MNSKKNSGRGQRELKIRVKSAKGRPVGSTRWLQRQLNDPYVHLAKKQGWRSRSAFKLLEIDDKLKVLKPGQSVLDLGCAPGGWCQVAVIRVNSLYDDPNSSKGKVIGIDLNETEAVAGADLYQMNFLEENAKSKIQSLNTGFFDVILSDMASPMIGHKQTDQMRTMVLAEEVFDFAQTSLANNGTVIAKVLSGGAHPALQSQLKQTYRSVKHIKPPASRSGSSERYVVAQGFKT